MISRLHYIIPDSIEYHQKDWYEKISDAGIDWIQLRWKSIEDAEFIDRIHEVQDWLKPYKTKLIVNDRIHLKGQIEVDGFHLGKKDCSLEEGRVLAESKILGGTTNTKEDIAEAFKKKVDYVGLGPYKFTRTKEGLSPVLGYLGYLNILRSLSENERPPVIAIGNIKTKDVLPLLKIGVHGVAVSSYFNENTVARIKDMLNEIELYKING